MMVQKEADDDDEEESRRKQEEEERKKLDEEKAKEEVKEEPTSKGGRDSQAKKADPKNAGNKGSQAKLEPVQLEPVVEDKNEPNKHKFVPHVVRIERSLLRTAYKTWEIVMHQQILKPVRVGVDE